MFYWAAGVTGLTMPAMKRWAREGALSMERQFLRSKVGRGGTRPYLRVFRIYLEIT
jgi:hypothetical protein